LIRHFQSKFTVLECEGFEDLLQECLTHWFFKRDQFDPLKPAAYKTYMAKVIVNKLQDIAESQGRQKRKALYKSVSIDELLGDDEDLSAGFLSVEDENFDKALKSDACDVLLKALEKLSRRQQELCRLIREEGLSLNQAGSKLNIPRATVYDEILRIREVFRREGLKDYL
jgi:RNA polymerase sigma-70 factor (ECF subfamily)